MQAPLQALAPAPPAERQPMSGAMRDALIAEVLGDVGKLHDLVHELVRTVGQMHATLGAEDLVRWRKVLEAKLAEIEKINLTEQASLRLEGHAAAYLKAMSRDINRLVDLEVQRQKPRIRWLDASTLWIVLGISALGVVLGNLVWAVLLGIAKLW